jgi:hypothetical protein
VSVALAELGPGPEWILRAVDVPSPGLGQPFTIAVPGSFEWRIVALNFQYAVAAAGTPRGVFVRYLLNSRELVRVPIAQRQAAPSACTYTYAPDAGAVVGGTPDAQVLVPLPDLPLASGYSLLVTADNLNAGDLFAAITLTVWERFTGDRPPERPTRPALVQPLDLGATVQE